MPDLLAGVIEYAEETQEFDLPSTATPQYVKFPTDFNVNWIEIDNYSQNATDAATLAEKLVKLGGISITTKSKKGEWAEFDADDLFYRQIARIFKANTPVQIGAGGATDDAFASIKLVLDAGLGMQVNSICGWTPDMLAQMKINIAADAGLDNCRIRIKFCGYKGSRPRYCLAVDNHNETWSNTSDSYDFQPRNGEVLQELWVFNTTDSDLATITTRDALTLKEVVLMKGNKDLVKYYSNQLQDGIIEDVAVLLEYGRKTWDYNLQGLGWRVDGDDFKVRLNAGAADAIRAYLSVLQPI